MKKGQIQALANPKFLIALVLIGILFFSGVFSGLASIYGSYSKTEHYETNVQNSFTSVSRWNPTGWIDTSSCKNKNNGNYGIPGCPHAEQEYRYLTKICTEETPKEAAIFMEYHYSDVNCWLFDGSQCNGHAQLYAKAGNKYFDLGDSETLYTDSKHVKEKYYYSHSTGQVGEYFENNCIDIYVGKYYWYGYDGVTANIVLDRVSVNYNPLEENSTTTIPTTQLPSTNSQAKTNKSWFENFIDSIIGWFTR